MALDALYRRGISPSHEANCDIVRGVCVKRGHFVHCDTNQLQILGFKLHLLPRTEGFEIYITCKCHHTCTLQCWKQCVKNVKVCLVHWDCYWRIRGRSNTLYFLLANTNISIIYFSQYELLSVLRFDRHWKFRVGSCDQYMVLLLCLWQWHISG